MSTDHDIYQSVLALIDRLGIADAEAHAAQRADELLTAGDHHGAWAWLCILSEICKVATTESTSIH